LLIKEKIVGDSWILGARELEIWSWGAWYFSYNV